MQTANRRIRYQKACCTLPVLLLCAVSLTGCRRKVEPYSEVGLRITDENFLEFTGGGTADRDELDRLNGEIERLEEEYRVTREQDNRTWDVTCEMNNGDRILQGTIYISKEEVTILGATKRTRRLASFAYDTEERRGFTALDALEEDPLTGVEFSIKTNKAFKALEPDALILTTEMQGFILNDDATTKFLYVRIEEQPDGAESSDDPIEKFYYYDPNMDAMAELEWPVA